MRAWYMGGASSAAESGHITQAIVGVPTLVQSRGLNVVVVGIYCSHTLHPLCSTESPVTRIRQNNLANTNMHHTYQTVYNKYANFSAKSPKVCMGDKICTRIPNYMHRLFLRIIILL